MNITIKVIDNKEHRPGISGADWFWNGSDLEVRVSKMSDWRYEVCLALHETIEAILCKHNGVLQATVDDYDMEYEATHSKKCNAGDETDSPYRREHCFATAAERIVAAELGVPWLEYDTELEKF